MEVVFVKFLLLTSLLQVFGEFSNFESNSHYEWFKSCIKQDGIHSPRLVSRSNSTAYEILNYQWLLRGPMIFPLGYLLVGTDSDVVRAVKCGRATGVELVPKGGGHSFGKYSFGNKNSVVVDVRDMDKLRIDESKMTATVGAGWLLGLLYWELYKRANVFTPLGICPTVGLPGLGTGGGYSFYTRQVGLATDNILQMKIVTSNGTILTANRMRNEDLYWALRGGVGSNFGIITEFVFKLYPAPQRIFYGGLTFPLTQFARVLDVFQKEVTLAPNSVTFTTSVYDQEFAVHFFDIEGTGDNFEEIAKKFPPPATVTRKYFSYPEFLIFAPTSFLHGTQTGGYSALGLTRESFPKTYYDVKSFYVKKLLGEEELLACQELVEEVSPYLNIIVEAYDGAINNYMPNETAFVHRGETRYLVQFSYVNPRNSDENIMKKFYMHKFWNASKRIFEHEESYQNYIDPELTDYLERFFGSNLPRLMEIKKKYDPDYFFHLQQSIPPIT